MTQDRACLRCGGALPPLQLGPPRKYCTPCQTHRRNRERRKDAAGREYLRLAQQRSRARRYDVGRLQARLRARTRRVTAADRDAGARGG